ncbi:hypothetical protein F5Y12DRAFT_719406 [Xylaria sp. FL1777]|nr:hypothetical protein F5Y12DRAFT_719406 [Xylaria sp. FL1777]
MADRYDYEDHEDDSDGIDVRCQNLDEFDSDNKLQFKLHESYTNTALVEQGHLRSYDAKNGTLLFYDDKPSDYSIVVDRILWVDGYDSRTVDGQHNREMTLIVLQIKLRSADPESKFSSFTAELRFEDKEGLDIHGPLREVTNKKEGGAKAGYQGIELSGIRSREEKTSWTQVHFDEGTSDDLYSDKLSELGITPEIWVAVLLSRSSKRPYMVKFRLDARGGNWREVVQGTKRFFGLSPDETKPFSVTPWVQPICQQGEGERIRNTIDPDNLEKLRDPSNATKLTLPLGPDYHLTASEVSSRTGSGASGEDLIPRPAEAVSDRDEENAAASLQRDAPRPQPQRHSIEELSLSNSTAVAPVRLATPESRIVQAEALIKILELTILELRKALLNIKGETQQQPSPY